MRILLIISFIFFCFGVTSQLDSVDYSSLRPIEKIFYQGTKSHQLILDAEIGTPIFNIGLNYFYHINPYVAVGIRVGGVTHISQQYPYPNERVVKFKGELFGSVRLYRSIRFETGIGIKNNYFPEQKEWSDTWLVSRAGISVNLFKYAFLRGGATLIYDNKYDSFFFQPYGAIGVSFKL
ncbi:MAG: hypothetical protein QNK23_00775 [Crocinitomicaceae bacterium]|nr:hypothetical protein [Crocinitomicaceae bacterium]